MWIAPVISFRWVPPPLQPGVVGPFVSYGVSGSQSFAAGGNQSYLELWAVIHDLRYRGILPRHYDNAYLINMLGYSDVYVNT
jgi:hypothetical protein